MFDLIAFRLIRVKPVNLLVDLINQRRNASFHILNVGYNATKVLMLFSIRFCHPVFLEKPVNYGSLIRHLITKPPKLLQMPKYFFYIYNFMFRISRDKFFDKIKEFITFYLLRQ